MTTVTGGARSNGLNRADGDANALSRPATRGEELFRERPESTVTLVIADPFFILFFADVEGTLSLPVTRFDLSSVTPRVAAQLGLERCLGSFDGKLKLHRLLRNKVGVIS